MPLDLQKLGTKSKIWIYVYSREKQGRRRRRKEGTCKVESKENGHASKKKKIVGVHILIPIKKTQRRSDWSLYREKEGEAGGGI